MINNYLSNKNKKETNELLVSLRRYANDHKVPIITYEGINFLNQIIKLSNASKVLEIGTAIGYSSISMVKNTNCIVTSIERDETMYNEAIKNIKAAGLEDNINVIFNDALLVDETQLGEFDLIFIDAAKAQSIKFFEKYETLLSDKGVIVTDNLVFHGLVVAEIKDRNLKQLVRKIDTFNDYVVNRKEYDSFIYQIGDGMSVSIKRK
ncbi:hypothetical protein CI105_05710 [Candidatus Izimaplasma bacterium ZiA1]|uniref:O-methyltransferase n=1 Tax=Candidatus Izimoplasma sp. ZiA1 TaxID=2024899 RepID=UPI000BAA6EA7|nr:hypothetical protein CI105_05710 [Candidatus Izimaplasma bacterium ZiA1]